MIKNISHITTVNRMARGALQQSIRLANCHARRLYHSSGPLCLTVAKLLNSPPSIGSVTVNGFIRSIRNQKQRSFAVIGDGTSLEPLQALLTPDQAQRYGRFIRLELWLISLVVSPLDAPSLLLEAGEYLQMQKFRPMSCT
jgi:hypothetical protein